VKSRIRILKEVDKFYLRTNRATDGAFPVLGDFKPSKLSVAWYMPDRYDRADGTKTPSDKEGGPPDTSPMWRALLNGYRSLSEVRYAPIENARRWAYYALHD
jgi:hypothetical protein